MKIKVLLFLLVLLQTNIILAQTKRFQIGLEGGPNLANINGKYRFNRDLENKLGYVGSLSLQYEISKIFSVRTGVGFERKGYKDRLYSPIVGVDGGKFSINFDYLTVPLLARVSFGKKVLFLANAGAYFAYLLNVNDSRDLLKNAPVSWKQYYKRFDWGITAGIGGAVPVNENLLLTLELRYNFGLYNYLKEINNFSFKRYNNSANLLAGIAYRF